MLSQRQHVAAKACRYRLQSSNIASDGVDIASHVGNAKYLFRDYGVASEEAECGHIRRVFPASHALN